MSQGSRRLGCLKFVVATVAVVALVVGGWLFSLNEDRPASNPSPEADQLARKIMAAGNHDAWQATGAIRWNFGGRQLHVWDRQRNLARVQWDDLDVLIDLSDQQGIVHQAGERLDPAAAAPHLQQAWSHWCNDSFWLNPLEKLFDDGVVRSLVDLEDGGRGLLVEYTQGGVTPGDAYLWIVDDTGLPKAWKMWTQILPLQGLETSWEDWITVETGARISTRHKIVVVDLVLSDITAATDIVALQGNDPFAELVATQ